MRAIAAIVLAMAVSASAQAGWIEHLGEAVKQLTDRVEALEAGLGNLNTQMLAAKKEISAQYHDAKDQKEATQALDERLTTVEEVVAAQRQELRHLTADLGDIAAETKGFYLVDSDDTVIGPVQAYKGGPGFVVYFEEFGVFVPFDSRGPMVGGICGDFALPEYSPPLRVVYQ